MLPEENETILVGLVSDLIFQVKIEAAAASLGYPLRWIERPAAPGAGDELGDSSRWLVEQLSRWQPALVLVDLSSPEIPWRNWLARMKTDPATRRIPVIAYGSHVAAETLQAARSAGADLVVARSRLAAELPELITRYARRVDHAALQTACQGALSELARRGLELFNHGEYFEAHELLELAWNEEPGPARELYRAILQAAVAYLQIERGNYNGAVKMFQRLRQWINPLPEECRGVAVGRLRQETETAYAHLLELGRERIQEFDRRLLKPVVYTD